MSSGDSALEGKVQIHVHKVRKCLMISPAPDVQKDRWTKHWLQQCQGSKSKDKASIPGQHYVPSFLNTKFAAPDKCALLGSTRSHTGNRGWSLTRAGNQDHFLWFVFCASPASKSVVLAYFQGTTLLIPLSISLQACCPSIWLLPPWTCKYCVSAALWRLIFKPYYPRCYYFLCMLVFWFV